MTPTSRVPSPSPAPASGPTGTCASADPTVNLSPYAGRSVRLQAEAEAADLAPASLAEAAVDDVRIVQS